MSIELIGKIGRIVGPIIVSLQTAVVIYLGFTVNFPEPPPQKKSNFTGLPIWEADDPSSESLYDRKVMLSDYVVALVVGLAGLIAIFFAARRIDNRFGNMVRRLRRASEESLYINRLSWTTYILSFILTAYINATFLAVVANIAFGLGKLWSIVGIFHNIMEVCLLAALLQTGRKQFNFAIALLVVVTYGVLATAGTSQLEWYYDSLVWDFMLPLVFFRVAVYAKNHPPNQGNPETNIVGDNSTESLLLFNLSYLIAFPIYAIYVHNESNIDQADAQKVFDVPDTSVYEFILIFLWGATSSLISAFIGVKNMN
ncbi:7046_t:CDS:2 [Entrophospora sp. SA101]|nr:8721_t:CDS:2 [Entrophospora sp. SA101]CAJ0830261.1 7046_t:CDS:2 [Entrophospora sp. SA101]CAJ0902394.1 10137_t:CDS:2 [Entrophospora sp. SA101]